MYARLVRGQVSDDNIFTTSPIVESYEVVIEV